MLKGLRIACGILGCLTLAACNSAADGDATINGGVSMVDGADPANWPSYGRTYGEQHFSPLDQINADTLDRLESADKMEQLLGDFKM